jgi:hypothetical protein
MRFRFKNALHRRAFSMSCGGVLKTGSIGDAGSGGLTILTMLSHADLMMYLVAIKSLYRRFNEGQVAVLNDGSLTAADCNLLRQQIRGVKLFSINDVDTGVLPKGGCWERLLTVLSMAESSYVIQVDSDTLTLGDIPEVAVCFRENRPFLLGGEDGQKIVTFEENYDLIQHSASSHLQIQAERALPGLNGSLGRKYVRGCAAFVGFPRGSSLRRTLESFSGEMQQMLGAKWTEWGSEQVASNYLIANLPGADVLPYPKYASLWPGVPYKNAAFLHCLGTNRFKGGTYRKLAGNVVRDLGR